MSRAAAIVAGTGAAVAAPLIVALALMGTVADHPAACTPSEVEEVAGLDSEQSHNAAVIVAVGQSVGASAFGLKIALATAYQESKLINLDHGDRDSLGLFQQRPQTGWGTPAQISDPVYSSQAFFGGPSGPNSGEPPGLLDIPGWHTMPLTVAAQAVQRSAYPSAYAQWESSAGEWLANLLGTTTAECSPGGGMSCPPSGSPAEAGLTPDALHVLRCIASHFPAATTFHGVGDRPNQSDHPTGRAVDAMVPDWALPSGNELGWRIAEWVRSNQVCLGVTYVIWDAMIWSADRASDGWRPYDHPNGWTDANSLHRNHIHISVDDDAGFCVDGTWVMPLAGTYRLTAGFGEAGGLWTASHTGIDLATSVGITVVAAAAGKVTYGGWDGPYGLKVELTHSDGTRTWYAHLSIITVKIGTRVDAGDAIGQVGATGNVTGPHLHFEVHPSPQGTPVDPQPWMAARGVRL